MVKFDIDVAIEDGGICQRQDIHCPRCPIGRTLGYHIDNDELCDHRFVLELSKLIKEFM